MVTAIKNIDFSYKISTNDRDSATVDVLQGPDSQLRKQKYRIIYIVQYGLRKPDIY